MAKDKKKSKNQLPKKIAGVKVPKAVRRGRFAELLTSRTGQALIAEALLGAGALAAGAKAADNPRVRRAAHDAKEKVTHAGGDAGHDVSAAGATLAYAFGEAARAFAEALRHGGPAEPRSFAAENDEPAWTPDDGGSQGPRVAGRESRKKQQTAYEAGPL